MASSAQNTLPPVTEDAFLADRQRFWGSLCRAATGSVIALVILLVLMDIFLVG